MKSVTLYGSNDVSMSPVKDRFKDIRYYLDIEARIRHRRIVSCFRTSPDINIPYVSKAGTISHRISDLSGGL